MRDGTARRPLPAARGFTLIEMMVVIGLILILILLAIPSFRLLSGNRSTESGGNVIGAMLARARADAVGLQEIRGVAVYRDAASARTAVSGIKTKTFADWTAGTVAAPQEHTERDFVKNAGSTQFYVCVQTHTDTGSIPLTNTDYWRALSLTNAQYTAAAAAGAVFIDLVEDRDAQLLPTGVEARGATSWVTGGVTYRYTNPSIILFDGNGSLVSREFRILGYSYLALDMNWGSLANVATPPVPFYGLPNPIQGMSSIGAVLFDPESFANQNFTAQNAADEWLDTNATAVLVNRYNGTLVKGD